MNRRKFLQLIRDAGVAVPAAAIVGRVPQVDLPVEHIGYVNWLSPSDNVCLSGTISASSYLTAGSALLTGTAFSDWLNGQWIE